MYSAIEEKQVDMIMSYSTDGRIPSFKLRLLNDDQSFFPAYQAAYLIKNQTIKKYPEIIKALQLLEGKITENDIIAMNNEVDEKKIKPYEVAYNFLVKKNIVESIQFKDLSLIHI